METLVAQPIQNAEFDIRQRARNDAETWLAEVLDGSMRTPFEYTTDGHELYAEDGGKLGPIFEDAIVEAGRLQRKDARLSFELRRRYLERGEYQDMLAMVRGELPNTMVVVSDFPAELMDATEDIGGYNVTRKQAMLRVITYADGKLQMLSQSLDGSNRQALEAIYAATGQAPQNGELLGQRIHADVPAEDRPYVIDRLTGVYDRSLADQFGGEWYAGRQETERDTYEFAQRQHELIDRFVIRQLQGGISEEERYNIAALLSKRFEESKTVSDFEFDDASLERFVGGVITRSLDWELEQAGREARAEGKVFSGCGASAGGSSAEDKLREAGYGNQSENDDTDEFGPLEFYCTEGHWNRRPRGKKIKACRFRACKPGSVGC